MERRPSGKHSGGSLVVQWGKGIEQRVIAGKGAAYLTPWSNRTHRSRRVIHITIRQRSCQQRFLVLIHRIVWSERSLQAEPVEDKEYHEDASEMRRGRFQTSGSPREF